MFLTLGHSNHTSTACGHSMAAAHRKWKETKQQQSQLPGTAVPGCSLVSFHFLWAIIFPQSVLPFSPLRSKVKVSPFHLLLMHARHSVSLHLSAGRTPSLRSGGTVSERPNDKTVISD